MDILYFPTEQMISDYFTKPLQGYLFRWFCEVVMGWKYIDTIGKVIDESIVDCAGYAI